MNIKSILNIAAALTATALIANAAPRAFDFKDPKGVNNVQFALDAPLEAINGTGTGISGVVGFDPQNPEGTTGTIALNTDSLVVGNPVMIEHLKSAHWLDVEQYPEIRFELTKLEDVQVKNNQVTAQASGKLTIKDVTKEITAPVRLTHLPNQLGQRVNDPSVKGDLLVIRTRFEINRSEFNIQPGQNTDKVAEVIELTLSIAGASPAQ